MATVDIETLQRISMLRLRNKLMQSYEQQVGGPHLPVILTG